MIKVVLASASPRRSEILNSLNINHTVLISNVDEEKYKASCPIDLVKTLSYEKAKVVNEKVEEKSLVIGSDTIVVYNNKILGKPVDYDEAYKFLKLLSGNEHYVYSGIAMIYNNNIYINYGSTKVYMNKYTDRDIENYIKTKEPFDKAGAYGIQGIGSILVEKIEGDFFNVMGLPVQKLIAGLKYLGIDYFESFY